MATPEERCKMGMHVMHMPQNPYEPPRCIHCGHKGKPMLTRPEEDDVGRVSS